MAAHRFPRWLPILVILSFLLTPVVNIPVSPVPKTSAASAARVPTVQAAAVPAAPQAQIAASGEDVVLSWPHVSTDTGGQPVAVVKYRVWRATAPYKEPHQAGFPLIAEVPAPADNAAPVTFTDTRAYAADNPNYFYRVSAVSDTGAESAGSAETATFHLPSVEVPPDPVDVAPPIDPTVATTVAAATEFLYTGEDPIQTGVAPGTIEAHRVAVLRGRVLTKEEAPLPGVAVTILDHPEFGQTLTRADGMFDLAVNGGGLLTVKYEKDGYLPAQRQAQTPWEDYIRLDDVVLVNLDDSVTTVDLAASVSMQVAEGSVMTDDDGTRQAALLIPQGTAAEIVLPDGSTQPMTTLNVRATEYTVGDSGPQAMPAELPAQSGYTYAVELSADEAIAAGATDVRFSQPLYSYVENFLDFPVGEIVPAGYYDRERGVWVPSQNGKIIAIVGVTAGRADVDTDGDGTADDGAGLNISDAEREQLAARYAPGQSLWRVPVTHFTPWDYNWPYGPPSDAQQPNLPDPNQNDPTTQNPCHQKGSIIECEAQTLREAVPVAGTPFALYYGSDRVSGRESERTVQIPLSGASLPNSLTRIDLEVTVAGQNFTQSFAPAPNLQTTFTWNGLDAYERPLQGRQPIAVVVWYVYRAVYMAATSVGPAFGQISSGGVAVSADTKASLEFKLGQEWHGTFGAWDPSHLSLGSWSLDVQHAYDPQSSSVYFGNGRWRKAENLSPSISTVAGNGSSGYGGDGDPAIQAKLNQPTRVAFAPDGAFYIADVHNHRVRRVSPDGIITTVAGNGNAGYSGDGGPATQARLNAPYGVAVAPDGTFYISDDMNQRIRRVEPDGIITTFAGNGIQGYGGDGGPATQAKLYQPECVTLGPDGSLYVADNGNHRIRRVAPDGIITTVAGNGVAGFSGDGGPAAKARLYNPEFVAVASDGSLYIADRLNNRVRRVGSDGVITTIAGSGTAGFSGDGGPATQARLNQPMGVVLSRNNVLYIADYLNDRVRQVTPNGIITTVAGSGVRGYGGDGGPATAAKLNNPVGVAVALDTTLYIADALNHRIRRIAPPPARASLGDIIIPADDGQQIYVFDPSGRHVRTVHALTGAVLYQFTYDDAGRLASVADGDGNTTTIERDAGGRPTAIVAPFGRRTLLGVDANGYLNGITNPANETVRFTYTDDGLMTSMTDARNGAHAFAYDDLGRLTRDEDPLTGAKTLARVQSSQGYTVTVSSALGRETKYSIERRSVGGTIRRTTGPDGTRTQTTIGTDGSYATVLPDGTKIDLLEGPDPRFGMQSPLPKSRTVTTPGGKVSTTTTERTVALSNPDDILSLTSLTDKVTVNGRVYTSAYDAAGRTFTNTSPAGRKRTTTIDLQGRVTGEQVTGLEPVAYSYDARGRLETITQGSGASARIIHLTYDAQGYLETIVDPLNRIVRFVYDAAGRVTQQILPDNRVVEYAYDANSNVTGVTPPGRPRHSFTYNAVDLEDSYDPPDIGLPQDQTFNTHNLDRQVTRVALPTGQNLDFAYNATSGKLESLTFSRGASTFGYHATSGLLTNVAAPGGISLAFGYDGSLLTNESWTGAVPGSVGRTYDNNFRVTGVSVNGSSIAYGYDTDSLLTQAGSLTLTRNAQNGLLTGTTLSSVTDSWTYNGFGEPATYRANYSGSAVYSVDFERDALGRITRRTETTGGATNIYEYAYDNPGRLWTVMKNGTTVAEYAYDANGNRLSYTGSGGAVNGTYDAQDRLLTYGGANYAYTADGRLSSKTSGGQTTSYVYDELGNLVSVSTPGQPQIEYLIDGANRRIGKKVGGVPAQGFLYQNSLNPSAELDGSGNVVSRFIYGSRANAPDYMVKGGTTYRIVADHLGSPRLVIDVATGSIAQRMDYDEFGQVLQDTNPGFQPFGFAGGIYDVATALVRFGARDYDAVTGRWTAKDPMGFNGNDSGLYTYVWNDPLNLSDPPGLLGWIAEWQQNRESDAVRAAEQGDLLRAFAFQFQSTFMDMLKSFAAPVSAFDELTDPCSSVLTKANSILGLGMSALGKHGRASYAYEYYKDRGLDIRSVHKLSYDLLKRVRRLNNFYDWVEVAQKYAEDIGW